MMQRFLYSLLIAVFCSWLIPMGRFISHSHEAQACGGQRAICLCSAHWAEAKTHDGKIEIVPFSGHNTQRAPAGSLGSEFLPLVRHIALPLNTEENQFTVLKPPTLLVDLRLDSVPKIA